MITAKNTGLVIMYHYVLDSRESAPGGIRPLFVDEFEKQLDWLQDRFQIVAPGEFLSAAGDGFKSNSKPLCLLSFDDGTRDHVEIVAPILQSRSLSAVFFVLTWPSELRKMPVTQALHWVLGQPEEQIWAQIQDFAERELGGLDALGSAQEAARIYHYETGLRGLIKYAINFALPPQAAAEIISQIAAAQGKSLEELSSEWFLSESHIQQLDSMGMEVGMHGSSHQSATQLGVDGIADEVRHSSAYFKSLLGKEPIWFCCPFGGSDLRESSSVINQACREVNVGAIATSEKAFVTPETNLYEIPRYDCIYLPPRSDELLKP